MLVLTIEERGSDDVHARSRTLSIAPLILFQHRAIDAPGAAARESEIQKYKAKKNRSLTAIREREEAARRMRHEVGEGHLAEKYERHNSGVDARQQQQTADGLEDRGENEQAVEGRPGRRKTDHLRQPVFQEQQRGDNTQNAEDVGAPPRHVRVK